MPPLARGRARAHQTEILVCLGATAAQALLGRSFRVTAQRGELVKSELAEWVTATVHPSSILRARTHEEREQGLGELVADLTKVAEVLRARPRSRELPPAATGR